MYTIEVKSHDSRYRRPIVALGLSLLIVMVIVSGWFIERSGETERGLAAVVVLRGLNAEFSVRNGLTTVPAVITNWALDSPTPVRSWTRASLESLPIGNIEGIYLHKVKDIETAIIELKWLPALRELRLSNSRVSDKHLVCLDHLLLLEDLDLSYTDVTDGGLEHVRNLSELHDLNLAYTDVTDVALRCLTPLGNLRHLSLLGNKITDGGIEQIAMLDRLEVLDVSRTLITDDGVKSLRRMKSLRDLDLTDTKVSSAAVAELRAALPGCSIRHFEH